MVVAGDISDERTLEAPGTRLRVKPEPVGQRLPTSRVTRGWKPSRLSLTSVGGRWSGRWESNISLGYRKHLIIIALPANQIAACDFCVKNDATPANASQCEHWSWVQ